MRKPMIIGLTGLAGSGKSTAACWLRDIHNYRPFPLAGPLKAMCRAFGLSGAEMTLGKELPLERLGGKSPRQFMQLLGTEFGRQMIEPDLWLKAWRHSVEMESLVEGYDGVADMPVVADDVRFANEAEAIRALGGIIIRITRPGAGSETGAAHASENQDIKADYEILNDGNHDQLFSRIDQALTKSK